MVLNRYALLAALSADQKRSELIRTCQRWPSGVQLHEIPVLFRLVRALLRAASSFAVSEEEKKETQTSPQLISEMGCCAMLSRQRISQHPKRFSELLRLAYHRF